MNNRIRDEDGRFTEKVTDQDVLKVFDYEATDEDPYLTAREITDALAEHFHIDVTPQAVRIRLDAMCEAELVVKRQFGNSVAYRALVGPRLNPDVEERLAERADTPRDEYVRLDRSP